MTRPVSPALARYRARTGRVPAAPAPVAKPAKTDAPKPVKTRAPRVAIKKAPPRTLKPKTPAPVTRTETAQTTKTMCERCARRSAAQVRRTREYRQRLRERRGSSAGH